MADTIPEVIEMARRSGLDSVADRLDHLYRLDRDNGDAPMNFYTVRLFVLFLMEHPEITTNAITINPDGFIHASWSWTQDDILQTQFFPTGNVWFSYYTKNNSEQLKLLRNGEMSPNDMLKTVMPLIKQAV